jgi:hypothetical protein
MVADAVGGVEVLKLGLTWKGQPATSAADGRRGSMRRNRIGNAKRGTDLRY